MTKTAVRLPEYIRMHQNRATALCSQLRSKLKDCRKMRRKLRFEIWLKKISNRRSSLAREQKSRRQWVDLQKMKHDQGKALQHIINFTSWDQQEGIFPKGFLRTYRRLEGGLTLIPNRGPHYPEKSYINEAKQWLQSRKEWQYLIRKLKVHGEKESVIKMGLILRYDCGIGCGLKNSLSQNFFIRLSDTDQDY